MPGITIKRERTDRWIKMRPSRARSSGPGGSSHMLSSADCITTASSLSFRYTGAPRIHGELLKLGIDVGQTTVAKYMARRSACFVRPTRPKRRAVPRHISRRDPIALLISGACCHDTLRLRDDDATARPRMAHDAASAIVLLQEADCGRSTLG